MNMNNSPKKVGMGWNKCFRLIPLLMFLCLNLCAATAQDKVQLDVTRLVGADPASIVNVDNTHRLNPNDAKGEGEKRRSCF